MFSRRALVASGTALVAAVAGCTGLTWVDPNGGDSVVVGVFTGPDA